VFKSNFRGNNTIWAGAKNIWGTLPPNAPLRGYDVETLCGERSWLITIDMEEATEDEAPTGKSWQENNNAEANRLINQLLQRLHRSTAGNRSTLPTQLPKSEYFLTYENHNNRQDIKTTQNCCILLFWQTYYLFFSSIDIFVFWAQIGLQQNFTKKKHTHKAAMMIIILRFSCFHKLLTISMLCGRSMKLIWRRDDGTISQAIALCKLLMHCLTVVWNYCLLLQCK